MSVPCHSPILACLTAAALLLSPAAAQTTTRVSVDSAGAQGNGASGYYGITISADGHLVAFESIASNLVAGDTNGKSDIFVHDRQSGQTTRISLSSAGVQGNGDSEGWGLSFSADNRFLVFRSAASNLVPGDTNGKPDVFVRDLQLGLTSRVSVDSFGVPGNGDSGYYGIYLSADARLVAFASPATNLVPGDTNGSEDIFLHDRITAQTTRISVDSSGGQSNGSSYWPVISANGQYVVFFSRASNLVHHDTNLFSDTFVHEIQTGKTVRVSDNPSGEQANGESKWATISGDGRLVAFESSASNLVRGDRNNARDIFVRDRETGQITLASVDSSGVPANYHSSWPSISADGRRVAFYSLADNLAPNDVNVREDVFVHHLQSGVTSHVSVNSSGLQGNGTNWIPIISANSPHVAFLSDASNLAAGDTNGDFDVFVHEARSFFPLLTKVGNCPGLITVTISNATAGGKVAIACGTAGVFVRSSPPCAGLLLSVSPPALTTVVTADGAGIASLSFTAPSGLCGRSVQGVDATTCLATNVIVL